MRVKSLISNLSYLLSFSIPLIGYNVTKYILALVLFFKLLDIIKNINDYKMSFKSDIKTHFFLSFFFLTLLISLFYSDNLSCGFQFIAKYSFFLIFQLVFINTKFSKEKILKSFMCGVMFIQFLNILLLCIRGDIFKGFNNISYQNLSEVVGLHPGYYSLIVLISIFINHFYVKKRIKYIIFTLQILFLFLLATRLFIIVFFLIITIYYLNLFIKKKRHSKYLSFSLIVVFVIIFFLLANTGIYRLSNFSNAYNIFVAELNCGFQICTNSITNDFIARIYQFKCSLQLIFKNVGSFLFGYGIGDFKIELLNQYDVNNFEWGVNEKFNSHNQYLSTMLMGGMFSLISLVSYFLYPLFTLTGKSRMFYMLLLVLFLSYSLTESYLLREHGILFVSFFVTLSVFNEKEC